MRPLFRLCLLVLNLGLGLTWLIGAPAQAQTAGVRSVATGLSHSCAVSLQGQVFCWGANDWGQLGDGTRTPRSAPVHVSGLPGSFTSVSLGENFSCALSEAGEVYCWGENQVGQLGNGSDAIDSPVPAAVAGLGSGVRQLGSGGTFSCAVDAAERAFCWGGNFWGGLGDGTYEHRNRPVRVTNLAAGVQRISVGQVHACALTQTGRIACWGANNYGQLGIGSTESQPRATRVGSLGEGNLEIAAGLNFTCALRGTRRVFCWGLAGMGQIGPVPDAFSTVPLRQTEIAPGARGLVTAGFTACALDRSRSAFCWGDNTLGQLGTGFGGSRSPAPIAIAGLGSGVQSLSRGAGSRHLCAILRNGTLRCWGANDSGQLGLGSVTGPQTTPGAVLGRLHRR